MISGFQPSAFQSNAFQIGDEVAPPIVIAATPSGRHKRKFELFRETVEAPLIVVRGKMVATEEGIDTFHAYGTVRESDRQVQRRRNTRTLLLLS